MKPIRAKCIYRIDPNSHQKCPLLWKSSLFYAHVSLRTNCMTSLIEVGCNRIGNILHCQRVHKTSLIISPQREYVVINKEISCLDALEKVSAVFYLFSHRQHPVVVLCGCIL